jgi:hypothetical protein
VRDEVLAEARWGEGHQAGKLGSIAEEIIRPIGGPSEAELGHRFRVRAHVDEASDELDREAGPTAWHQQTLCQLTGFFKALYFGRQ